MQNFIFIVRGFWKRTAKISLSNWNPPPKKNYFIYSYLTRWIEKEALSITFVTQNNIWSKCGDNKNGGFNGNYGKLDKKKSKLNWNYFSHSYTHFLIYRAEIIKKNQHSKSKSKKNSCLNIKVYAFESHLHHHPSNSQQLCPNIANLINRNYCIINLWILPSFLYQKFEWILAVKFSFHHICLFDPL